MIRELLSNTTVLKFSQPVVIENFSPAEKAQAWMFAQQVYIEAFESGNFTIEEIDNFLAESGIWTEEDEKIYVEDIKRISSMKIEYLDNFFLPTRKNSIRRLIENQLYDLNCRFVNKTYLYEYSCESLREEAYIMYFFRNYDNPLKMFKKFILTKMSEEYIRNLYFDKTWRQIWTTCKDPASIFGINMNYLNDNQLSLLYWSKLYDNICESQDAPEHDVLKDVIAIDGWLAKQSIKRENEEKRSSLPNDKGEVFVPVKNKQEAKEVFDLNTMEGKQVLKSISRDLKNNGNMNEGQMSHVKRQKMMAINMLNTRR